VGDQVVVDGLGTTLGQALVVGVATDAVGVTGSFDADVRVLLQDFRGLVQGLLRFRTQGRLVEVELDTAQVDGDLDVATIRTDDRARRRGRALVVAVVHAVAVTVQLGAVWFGRRGRRRKRFRLDRGFDAAQGYHDARGDDPVTEVVDAGHGLVVHVVAIDGFGAAADAVGEVEGQTRTGLRDERPAVTWIGVRAGVVARADVAVVVRRTGADQHVRLEAAFAEELAVGGGHAEAFEVAVQRIVLAARGAVDGESDRGIVAEVLAQTERAEPRTFFGVAVLVTVVVAHAGGDIPAISGLSHASCRKQAQRDGSHQAVTFHRSLLFFVVAGAQTGSKQRRQCSTKVTTDHPSAPAV